MIVGVILAGCGLGAVAALSALLMGQTIWMALLIYSATGCACVLAVAVFAARRPEPRSDTKTRPVRLQRG